jgi:hypothetical protein
VTDQHEIHRDNRANDERCTDCTPDAPPSVRNAPFRTSRFQKEERSDGTLCPTGNRKWTTERALDAQRQRVDAVICPFPVRMNLVRSQKLAKMQQGSSIMWSELQLNDGFR